MDNKCPRCGMYAVVIDREINKRESEKYCYYCLLCGWRSNELKGKVLHAVKHY